VRKSERERKRERERERSRERRGEATRLLRITASFQKHIKHMLLKRQ
jgi:hypothetical protein